MDVDRFETLLRSLAAPSRRRALGIVGGSLLGSLLTSGPLPIGAKKGKGKGRKKKRRGQSPPLPPPSPPSPPPPPGPTCTDTVKNGSESDIDCGGTCPRCINGKACNSRSDCASAFCNASATCIFCSGAADCPADASGGCSCVSVGAEGTKCMRIVSGGFGDCSTNACPAGTAHCELGGGGFYACYKLCGQA